MRQVAPTSRRQIAKQAEQTLNALLRTPKTRDGLIAAVSGNSITRNFVYGWLSNQVRVGSVTVHKSSDPFTYQLTVHTYTETPGEGVFPVWLEPRWLPTATPGRVYIDGRAVGTEQETEEA